MVDIKDTSVLSASFCEKIDTVSEVDGNHFLDDDPMDNLAYSDSESASIAMPDDEFCDALDQLAASDGNVSSKNGKYGYIFLNFSKTLLHKCQIKMFLF